MVNICLNIIIESLKFLNTEIIIPIIYLSISTFVGAVIVRKVFMPCVEIKAKKKHILKDKTGFFVSINIVNIGHKVANNTICYLLLDKEFAKNDLIEESDASLDEELPRYLEENLSLTIPRSQLIGPQKYRSLEQIHFCWTHHGNPYSKDINPGITAALDVCRIQWENDKHYIIFPTERGWRKVHFRVNYAPIEGRLFICPANAYPNIFHIKIYMDDQETPQLDIRKIKLHFWNRKKELLN